MQWKTIVLYYYWKALPVSHITYDEKLDNYCTSLIVWKNWNDIVFKYGKLEIDGLLDYIRFK